MTDGLLRFDGKAVLVTGASSGIGREVALAFARAGARWLLLAGRNEARTRAAAEEAEALGAVAIPFVGDLSDRVYCATMVDRLADEAGRVDVVVGNAAHFETPTPAAATTDTQWDAGLAINLTANFILARSAARTMLRAGQGGSIIFTSSGSALGAGRGIVGYCVAKAGLLNLARVMGVELAPAGIRVNVVSPGPVATEAVSRVVGDVASEAMKSSNSQVPMRRVATPSEIAGAYLFLASESASYITGANLLVDGGLSAYLYDPPWIAELFARTDPQDWAIGPLDET